MSKNTTRKRPDRPRFKVTLVLSDGTELKSVLYANNAEHAKRKALKEVPPDREVSSALAEEEKG